MQSKIPIPSKDGVAGVGGQDASKYAAADISISVHGVVSVRHVQGNAHQLTMRANEVGDKHTTRDKRALVNACELRRELGRNGRDQPPLMIGFTHAAMYEMTR